MSPQSNAFGNSFEQWNVLQTQWALALGSEDATELSDTVGRVRLLPGDFTSSTPVFNITLADMPFVASPFFRSVSDTTIRTCLMMIRLLSPCRSQTLGALPKSSWRPWPCVDRRRWAAKMEPFLFGPILL